jgi:hypothetical protein
VRNQWRIIDTVEKRTAARSAPQQVALMHLQKERIRRELESTCMEIVELLENFLIDSASAGEEKVFYSKMSVARFLFFDLLERPTKTAAQERRLLQVPCRVYKRTTRRQERLRVPRRVQVCLQTRSNDT